MLNTILLTLFVVALVGLLGPPVIVAAAAASGALLLMLCAAIVVLIVYILLRLFLAMIVIQISEAWQAMYGESKKNKQHIAEQ